MNKELSTSQQENNPTEKEAKYVNTRFFEEDIQMANRYMKKKKSSVFVITETSCNISNYQRKSQ